MDASVGCVLMRNGLTKDCYHKLNMVRRPIKSPSLERVERLLKKKEENKKKKLK